MKMRGAVSTLVADADRVGRLEARVAVEHRAAVHAAQPALDAGARRSPRPRRRAPSPSRHVDRGRRRRRDAVVGAAPREMRGVGAGDQRLGRHAAGVDAGAAEQLPLDEGHLHAGARSAARRAAARPGRRR